MFARYLGGVGLKEPITGLFGGLRKNKKGLSVWENFVQLFCFLAEGTSRHLVHFDRLKNDPAYAALLETTPDKLLSSHQVKRFFRSFNFFKALLFRKLLRQLFLWRLKLEAPSVVILGLDTMVMDNDEAQKREGVKPTYKKVKGYQPLQLTWGRFIVDAQFRSGEKHSNHGDDAVKMVTTVVKLIRAHYRAEVPFLIRMDSGFFDEKLFAAFAEDVCESAVPVTAYPTRVRRTVFDIAAKFVRHAGQVILKIARPVWDALNFGRLWKLANAPPSFAWL